MVFYPLCRINRCCFFFLFRRFFGALDIVGGKWKFILIATLYDKNLKFNEIARECNISPRILSKELHELEINGLVNRKVCDTKPVTVEYSLTAYSKTLDKLILEMQRWGLAHREHIKQL